MMDRCEVKPCANTSFGTHTEFWDKYLGTFRGCTFNYGLWIITENLYQFSVPGSKKGRIRITILYIQN